MLIRLEKPRDTDAVGAIITAAFRGGPEAAEPPEARLLERLRAHDGLVTSPTIGSMERFSGRKGQFVVIDDYGTGGIWGIIAAESAEAITRRYPQLRVITIGDPEWVTPEKYSEIVNEWIQPDERFDIDRPTGWLAAWGDRLSTPRESST